LPTGIENQKPFYAPHGTLIATRRLNNGHGQNSSITGIVLVSIILYVVSGTFRTYDDRRIGRNRSRCCLPLP
jgi:hypothetical protein